MSHALPAIDVCVASYKRPHLLARLLTSLASQETCGEFAYRIIVADNDASRSAEPVVQDFAARGAPIVYGVEPEQSISRARNKSLSLATADAVATTDDDLCPESRWLLTLHRAMAAHRADVVHGPVVSQFPPATARYIRECAVFHRPNPPTGSSAGYVFTTANALFRRALVAHLATPFDPRFGRTGGEDGAFFNAMAARGARMIWCREARVESPVPDERATLRWIARRRFRYGNTHLATGGPRASGRRVGATSLRLVTLAAAAPWQLAAGLIPRRAYDDGMGKVVAILHDTAFIAGMLARRAGYEYEEYRPR